MAVFDLTKENFDSEVLNNKGLVMVDFWATWCGPCRTMSPVVDQIAEEAADKLKVCKVNIDEQPELAERYQVMTIPTLMVFKDGKAVASTVGVQPKKTVLDMVEKAR